jgi:stage V sporulation protein B
MVLAMIISEVFSFVFLGAYYKLYQNKRIKIMRRLSSINNFANNSVNNFINKTAKNKIGKKNILSEISRIAVPICASSILLTIINSVNTILLPKRLVVSGMTQTQAVETLGILMGMSFPLVTLPVIFISPLMNVVLPRIASAKKLGDSADLNKKIAKTIKACAFLTFPAMAAVAALGQPLCMLMYKNETAGQYIIPLMLSSIFMYIQIVTGSILNAIDKQKELAVYNVIDGIVHILCTYFFVALPNFGVYGFMIGHFASSLLGTVLNLATVIKTVKLKFNFTEWLALPALAGLYTGFMTYFTYNFCIKISVAPVLSVIIALLLSMIIYIAVLELRGVSVTKYLLRIRANKITVRKNHK